MSTVRDLRLLHLACRHTRPALTSSRQVLFSTSTQRPEKKIWADRLPVTARSYLYLARIDKPIGTLLLYYPCGRYLFTLYSTLI
jgi:hypothetical protein